MESSGEDLENWHELISAGSRSLNATLTFVRESSDSLEEYAKGPFLPSMIVGNVVGIMVSMLLMMRLIFQFRLGVKRMREGHPEGKHMIAVLKHSGITAIQIPKLVGMTLTSFLINFWLLTFLVSFFAALVFGPIGDLVVTVMNLDPDFLNLSFNFVLETAAVTLFLVVGLDFLIGNKMLLNGTDEMVHPVLWTWYASVMITFNLAKAAALAATRIMFMNVLNLCQFAIIDSTVFPPGREGMDPAYSSFAALVNFTSKYRNPILTSLFVLHKAAQKDAKKDDDCAAQRDAKKDDVDADGTQFVTHPQLRLSIVSYSVRSCASMCALRACMCVYSPSSQSDTLEYARVSTGAESASGADSSSIYSC